MAKYQKYSEYKDSGVEWLGEIPSCWKVIRLKHLILDNLVYGANEAAEDDNPNNPRYIRITDMNSDGSLDPNTFRSLPYHIAQSYLLQDGDILLARSGATVGKSFLFKSEFGTSCFAGYLIRARSNKSKLNPKFAYWFFQSESYWKYVSGSQIQATIQNVSAEKYGDLYLSVPEIQDQGQIANFLDYETTKIDTLIAKQEKLIELLKEKRQAVISHAVTKGLNPNVPMKDSGVEWLGEVPAHWDIAKLKWKAVTTSGSTPTTSKYELYYENGDIPWIRTTDLNNGDLYETPIFITPRAVNNTACSILPVNSILIAMYGGAGSIGKHSLLKFESTINQAVCGVLPSKFFEPNYLHRFYEFYRPFWMVGASGTRKDPNIGQDHIKEALVPIPPIEEQTQIAQHISEIQTKFDDLTKKAESAIQLMQERRTALISAAVTGKIDVRHWQNPHNNNNQDNMELSA